MRSTTPKTKISRKATSRDSAIRGKTKESSTKVTHQKRMRRELIVGWREWVGLPALNVEAIRAKIDTGARSSSLHAKDIETFDRDGQSWVRFEVVADHGHERNRIPCVAPVADIRSIKNSFGVSEERVIIRTLLRISNGVWPIEVSLADRAEMTYPALLGRTALRRHAIIDPSRSYICKWINDRDLPLLPSE